MKAQLYVYLWRERVIKIVICDDQEMVCEGLKVIFTSIPDFEVVGIAHDGEEALDVVSAAKPDVVLMDLKMPRLNGVQATRLLRQRYPNVRVLVLTTYDDDEWVFSAIQNGAAGYLLKDTPREALVNAIRGTVESMTFVDPKVAGKVFERVAHNHVLGDAPLDIELSAREREVLDYISQGYNNAEISATLCLSEGTVRNYVSALLAKLGVADRTQAAIVALRRGLVK